MLDTVIGALLPIVVTLFLVLLLSGLELPPQTSESFALLAKTTGGIALFASGM